MHASMHVSMIEVVAAALLLTSVQLSTVAAGVTLNALIFGEEKNNGVENISH